MSIIALKITPEYIEPAVTRTLNVPANIRLDHLHMTIQAAKGWAISHLYMFEAGCATWGLPDPDFGSEDLPTNKTTLVEVIEDTGARTIKNLYEFGDMGPQDQGRQDQRSGTRQTLPAPDRYRRPLPTRRRRRHTRLRTVLRKNGRPHAPRSYRPKTWYGVDFDPNIPDSDELRLEILNIAKRRKPKDKRLN